MAAFLHHCPYLKSVPKQALRRTGAALLSLADQCPIIARQITVSGAGPLDEKLGVSPTKSTVDQRRLFAQTATEVAVSASKGCPFVTSQIGMVQASPEVQEDVNQSKQNEAAPVMLRWTYTTPERLKGRRMAKETSLCSTDRSTFLSHRFDEISVEGFQGFNRPTDT